MATVEERAVSAAPLGLVAFAVTNLLFSFVNAGWLPERSIGVLIPLAIVFGGVIQVAAGMLSYLEGNTFALVSFNTFGAFFLWLGLVELLAVLGVAEATPVALGASFLVWGVVATYLWVGTLKLNWGLCVLFVLVMCTLYLLGLGNLMGAIWLVGLGGYAGIVLGIAGLYLSFAEVVNWCFGREVVPLGGVPLGEAPGPELPPAAEPQGN